MTEDERKTVFNEVTELIALQEKLENGYRESMIGEKFVSVDLACENVFVYSLSAFARRVAEFAESLGDILEEPICPLG